MGWQPQEEWSDDQVQTASQMWKEGCTASQIGSKVGKSRSAVVGKANRNRSLFPARKKTSASPLAAAKAEAARANGRRRERRAPKRSAAIERLVAAASAGTDGATLARSISCQAVALTAPIEEITRAVRLGVLPEDAAPVAYDDVDACQCRWPTGSAHDIDAVAREACGAPVLDPASRIGMARTHCGFHFRAAGQDIGKVVG